MSAKTLVKELSEYRADLAEKNDSKLVDEFDRLLLEGRKIAAIRLLREKGILAKN